MSIRSTPQPTRQQVHPLQYELDALRSEARAANQAQTEEEVVVKQHFAGMSSTEVAAASLGVSADELKPIGFMNEFHFSTLLKNNALSDDLARRLDAYRAVAKADGVA